MSKQIEQALGLPPIPRELAPILSQCDAERATHGVFFLEADYLTRLQGKCNVFPRSIGLLQAEAAAIRQHEAASRYALFLCRAMEQRALFLQHLSALQLPQAYPLMGLLCFAPAIEKIWEELSAKALPADVITDSVQQFEVCVFLQQERTGVLGMGKRYFDHMQGYLDGKMLNVGRLRFERKKNKEVYLLQRKKDGKRVLFLANGVMNADGLYADTPPVLGRAFDAFFREDRTAFTGTPVNERGRVLATPVTLSKSEYEVVLAPGDAILGVHIPAWGAFNREICAESYARAREIFSRLYPDERYRAFHCHSWMLAPELGGMLKPTSNLLAFQEPYLRYPAHTKGEDVFVFVFGKRPADLKDLPEDTSLRRMLKERYLAGGYLYEYCGIIPF